MRAPGHKTTMGRRKRTLISDANLFFVTTTVRDWNPVFSSEKLDLLEKQLFALFPAYADALMGYVLMPSHIHILIGCRHGGEQLSWFMKTFKFLSARLIFPFSGSIWMPRFDDLVINTEKQFLIKLNYIHENPVRSGLVQEAIEWRWSSARFWQSEENHSVLKKEWNWETDESI